MEKRAVALFSGGLDSMLAIKMMMNQGVEVFALNFLTVFCTCTSKGCMHQATKAARQLGVPLKVMNITTEYMEVIKNPRFGRGRGMNPCIDCRVFTFRKARDYMEEVKASFVITGEVLGERPMSQRRQAIEIIERESGLAGLIVRPLSAKHFPPTVPEEKGVVDRERLLDIKGRRREPQFKLAEELGVTEYPCPAGGCLLTDEGFSRRLKDLFRYNPEYELRELHLLKTGRQFRVSQGAKLIVGRNRRENEVILNFAREGDMVFDAVGIPGPVGLLIGKPEGDDIRTCASIVARYSDMERDAANISYRILPETGGIAIESSTAPESLLSSLRI